MFSVVLTPLLVSEISTLGGFCDEDEEEQDKEELGILVVGFPSKWTKVSLALPLTQCSAEKSSPVTVSSARPSPPPSKLTCWENDNNNNEDNQI